MRPRSGRSKTSGLCADVTAMSAFANAARDDPRRVPVPHKRQGFSVLASVAFRNENICWRGRYSESSFFPWTCHAIVLLPVPGDACLATRYPDAHLGP